MVGKVVGASGGGLWSLGRVFGRVLGYCDHFDFDRGSARQGRDLNRGSRRERGVKISLIHGVHFAELREVRHEDRRLYNIGVRHAVGTQNAAYVFQDPFGLLGNAASDQFA